MVGTKRKDLPARGKPAVSVKKQKTVPSKPAKPRIPPPDLEAETDSDPIIESDTGEESGADDGVSWPSDHESDGGVELPGEEGTAPSSKKLVSGTNEANLNKSRESHAKQKVEKQERKAAKPNADLIARSKKIWERLRRQSHVPLEERKKLVAELFDIITGRVKDLVLKHDSGRIIQTALKYGKQNQKRMIAEELKGEYRTLAEGKYSKFTIGKLLSDGDEVVRDIVVPEFFGNVRRLIKHPEASWILDDIYRGAASKKQKAQILREWYGAEFAVFKSEEGDNTAELKEILAARPEKRASIMRNLFPMIDQMVQKKTTGFTMLHDAMLQYYLNVPVGSEEATDFIELLKGDEEGDLMKNLAFTASGARLVSLVFASGTAKDRKLLLRVYKGVIPTMAYDMHARKVLLSALDVTDDTVLISKSIYAELRPNELKTDEDYDQLMDLALNLNSRALVLYPLGTNPKSILTAEELSMLEEVHEIRTRTSKKDPKLRLKELKQYYTGSFIKLVAERAENLIQTSWGCILIQEILIRSEGEDKHAAMKAILGLLDRTDLHAALATSHVGRMLKTLAHGGPFNAETKSVEQCDPPLGFANDLWTKISGEVINWATGSNAFVLVALLESADFFHKEELKQRLQRDKEALQKAADEGKPQDVEKKKKSRKSAVASSGNKGSGLLLKMID